MSHGVRTGDVLTTGMVQSHETKRADELESVRQATAETGCTVYVVSKAGKIRLSHGEVFGVADEPLAGIPADFAQEGEVLDVWVYGNDKVACLEEFRNVFNRLEAERHA